MRLTDNDKKAIKETFFEIFEDGKIYLFGSRVDDTKRGGDIDLYISPSSKTRLASKKIDFLVALANDEQSGFPYIFNEKKLTEISMKKILIRNVGPTPTAIFRRKVLENTGYFDGNQRFAEDANYWLRVSENNKMFVFLGNR